MKSYKTVLFVAACLLLASCGTFKKSVLLNDIVVPSDYMAPTRHDLKIKKGDDLRIMVAHHNPKVVEMFNHSVSTSPIGASEGKPSNVFHVNSKGYITMPIFDSVKVYGLTCQELETFLMQRLENEGIAYGATVNVKIAGYKVTIIGETGTGVYQFEDNGATVLDLVAKASLAGGLGNNTRRDKILVMRERDSIWQSDYISLLTTDLFYSPYFYLEQNDVFYVYPTQTSIWKSDDRFDYWWSRFGMITSLVSLATSILIYTKMK